jgi:hypothetical protein
MNHTVVIPAKAGIALRADAPIHPESKSDSRLRGNDEQEQQRAERT